MAAFASSSPSLSVLLSYVPQAVARHLAVEPVHPPFSREFEAALLFADIHGFTPLSERLARLGPTGAETLSHMLNDYFGQLIDLITAHGGDIVNFAGDGLLALWPAENDAHAEPLCAASLHEATLRAAQCALALQKTLHNYQFSSTDTPAALSVSLRVGLGAGKVTAAHLGASGERIEFLIAGAPLEGVSLAEQSARPGEVVLGQAAWRLLEGETQLQPLANGCARLEAIHGVRRPRALPLLPLQPTADFTAWLGRYIPTTALRHDSRHPAWLAEMRRVTIIVLRLRHHDFNAATALGPAQRTVQIIQRILKKYNGYGNPLSLDEKGISWVMAFGLPGASHPDDAVRAVRAALDLQDELRRWEMTPTLALATGQVFCGPIGNRTRREYSLLGDVVNIAARVCETAGHQLLCDEATMQATRGRIAFERLKPLRVRGKADVVPVLRPLHYLAPEREAAASRPLAGRETEGELIAQHLGALRRGRGGVLVIEGEVGIGKSALLGDLLQRAASLHLPAFCGAGEAIEETTPYFAWRELFSRWLTAAMKDATHSFEDTPEARAEFILGLLNQQSGTISMAPLLNPIFALNLPENSFTLAQNGTSRATNTRLLLAELLTTVASRAPQVLVLEDAHWMDSASWALAWLLCRHMPSTLLVIVTRPLADQSVYTQIIAHARTQRIALDVLSRSEAMQLARQTLGVSALPAEAERLLWQKAEGHPFFTAELARALRDAGLLQISGEHCTLSPHAGGLEEPGFPPTIAGVITHRIDHLQTEHQLTLKVASVLGHAFSARELQEIYPVATSETEMARHIAALEQAGFTRRESEAPESPYLFQHVLTQEVAYSLMLASQRRALHRAAALWHESEYSGALENYYPLLAYHWEKAQEFQRAAAYAMQAGERALHQGAFHEAVHFLDTALRFAGEKSVEYSALQRARLHRQLGQANWGLGQLTASGAHGRRALEALGKPIPALQPQLRRSIITELARQLLFRARPLKPAAQQPANEELLEIARIYNLLASVFYYANEELPVIQAVLSALNRGERTGFTPELAHSYANMGMIAALVPLHTPARYYLRKATQVATAHNEPAAHAYALVCTVLYQIGVGHWTEAESTLRRFLEIAQQIGDAVQQREGLFLQANIAYYRGQWRESIRNFSALLEQARQAESVQHQAWGLSGQAGAWLKLRDEDRALRCARDALQLLQHTTDHSEEIKCHATIAFGLSRQGDYEGALRAAQTAGALIEQSPDAVSFYLIDAYAGVAHVYMTLWEKVQSGGRHSAEHRAGLRDAALQACRALRRYARVFPLGMPCACLYTGRSDWLQGRKRRARRAWQRGLQRARQLQMPYEEALVLRHLGAHMESGSPLGKEYLQRATQMLLHLSEGP